MTSEEKIQAFHVGAHKTGTSLVQRHLERRPDIYRGHGVDFIIRDEMSRLVSWGRALFGSYENLIGRPFAAGQPGLYPSAGRNLAALAEITDSLGTTVTTTVFLSVRRQSEFLGSLYLQAVSEGSSRPFGDWLTTVDLDRLSWRPLVTSTVELFGIEQVEIVDSRLVKSGQGGYVGRFMRVLDPDFDDRLDPPTRYNQSVPEKGLRMCGRPQNSCCTSGCPTPGARVSIRRFAPCDPSCASTPSPTSRTSIG